MRAVKKEKRGNCSVGIFLPLWKRHNFKEEEKEGRKKGMKSQNPSRFGEQPQNYAF